MSLSKAKRQLISKQTRIALQALKAKGAKLGNPSPTRDIQHLNPLAIASIKRRADIFAERLFPVAFTLRDEGWTLEAIAAEFNKRRIHTARNGRWHPTTIRNLLRRKKGLRDILWRGHSV
jgi:hypothetical protein